MRAPSKASLGEEAMVEARLPPARKPSSWPSSATGLTRLPAIVFELPVTCGCRGGMEGV